MRMRWVTLGALGLAHGCGGDGTAQGDVEILDGGASTSSSTGIRTTRPGGETSRTSVSEGGVTEVHSSNGGASDAGAMGANTSGTAELSTSSDESRGENTSADSQSRPNSDTSELSSTVAASEGDAATSNQSAVTFVSTEETTGGQSTSETSGTSPSSSTEPCSVVCELGAARCVSAESGLAVEQCIAGDAGVCPEWRTVDGCDNGSCLDVLINDSCDPTSDGARCEAGALKVCAPGASGCPVWQGPTDAMLTDGDVDIDEGATEFTGYGVLALKLTANVDETDLVACLRDTRDVATTSDSPAVEGVTAEGSGEYELQLSRYHLPVAYELAVAVGNPPIVRTTVLAPDVKSRVAFISKTQGNGDLASWTAEEDTPLDAADAVCQADAETAGLSGTFRAYLSIKDQTDAICRLRGGEGLLDEGCGLDEPLSEEQLTAPFLDMKGLPIAYGTKDIEQGLWRLPVGYGVDARAGGLGAKSWMGSLLSGVSAGSDCSGWTSSDTGARGKATANPGLSAPEDVYSLRCSDEGSLLCFAAEPGHRLSTTHENTGKLAYVLHLDSWTVVDLAVADAACREASGSDEVVAWYSDETDDALCRLVGLTGKVTDSCGGDGLIELSGPWVRADGYVVANTSSELLTGLRAPLNLDNGGNFYPRGTDLDLVRTDTLRDGTRGGNLGAVPCVNGDRLSIGAGWTYYSGSCSAEGDYEPFVYCFEQ